MAGADDQQIVDSVVAEGGPATALLRLEEKVVETLADTVREWASDVAVGLAGGADPTTAEESRMATFVTAVGSDDRILATRRLEGRRALALLPRAVHFARATGRTVELRTPGRSRRFVGPSVLAAPEEPRRSEADLVTALRKGGWLVEVEAHGVTVMRGRNGRELGLAILMVLLVTLFLPITAILVVLAALGGPKALRSLAEQWRAPFRRIDERIRVEVRPGALRWAVLRDGALTQDRTLDQSQLLAVHADGPFDEAILLVGPAATDQLPCLARGEPRQSFQPPQSDALADLIVRIWAKPPPGYRG